MIRFGQMRLFTSACESLVWVCQLFYSLRSTSTCESYVAIVIGSMPAFASFFKGEMPGASWLTGMNSLVRSNTVTPSSGGSMIPGGHTREKGYHELGSVRTDIRGEGAAPRTLEEGVVYKTVAVHQSMRQGRPAA